MKQGGRPGYEEVADAVEMVDVNKEGVVNNDTKRIKCFGFKVNLT